MIDTPKPTRREMIAGAAALAGSMLSSASVGAQAGSQSAGSGPSGPFANLKVLVFDTFGTVVDWRSVIIEEGAKLSKAKGLTVDWAKFADEWRGAYGPSMNRVRNGELPWTKLDVLHRMSLDTLLTKYNVTQLTEAEKVQLNKVWHRGRPWPDSVPGLTRLKKRFTIAPMSNGNISLLTDMAKHSGIPWDCILGAELVRHYKPDAEVYRSAADFLDLPPADVMMVAAHLGDLRAAKAVGLKTAFVARPLEYGPAGKPDLKADGSVDVSAADFNGLAAQLGA